MIEHYQLISMSIKNHTEKRGCFFYFTLFSIIIRKYQILKTIKTLSEYRIAKYTQNIIRVDFFLLQE